ncbi:MAG: diguanylate cyclase [Lachnospiraceae bacterium]|jgi:diguanylate cyclase (GGDEF)-like protein|nr:diguanylate cyclase [Lachnospiraceae bacterium]
MVYASYGIFAVILHLILNHDVIKNGKKESSRGPHYRYRLFLNALLVFYLSDLLWGFAADSGVRIIVYADTVLFFASMAVSVLLWTRYVVAFLNKDGTKANIFLLGGQFVFALVMLVLIINFFRPIVFTFTKDVEYKPAFGRNIILIVQFLLFIIIMFYSAFVAYRSEGRERSQYKTVCVTGGVMAVFIALQMFFPFAPLYTIGCFVGNCLLHVFVEEDEKKAKAKITEAAQRDKERYSQVSASLAADYDAIYYINIETGKYIEISSGKLFQLLRVPQSGDDFFRMARENVDDNVHPDDRLFAKSMYFRDDMKKNLEERGSFSYQYKIMIANTPRIFRFQVMLSEDMEHFVFCVKDIQDTITAENALKEKQKMSVTFTQIAESLASNYDNIYYVDIISGEYVSYTSKNIYGELKIEESGENFYEDSIKNASLLIHPQDRDKMLAYIDKDYLLSMLDKRKQFEFQYRLIVDDKSQHTRLVARKSSDGIHMIIGVENIDDEVAKEKEHLRALNSEKELARKDELTGIRNKTSFNELKQSIQNNIDKGVDYLPFAIAICDLNDLKKINDTKGHQAGDEYIIGAAKLLCDIFDHSPVFRIGGDEFAVFLSGNDFVARQELAEKLHKTSLENRQKGNGPVVAIGIADYDQSIDTDVNILIDRADHKMYEDKKQLKSVTQ